MDAARLEQVRAAIRASDYQRFEVERREAWRDTIPMLPALSFPPSWKVKIIPPFGGALTRFWVEREGAWVSVYADFYEQLGCWAEPHWEIYPGPSGENERFSIATDTEEMLKAIGKSLAKQARQNKRRTK